MDRSYFNTYLQTTNSFYSNSQSSFESGTTKHPLNKTLPTKNKLESESSPNQESKTNNFYPKKK